MAHPDEILSFWLDEVGPNGWYKSDEALDEKIRTRFGPTWQRAMDGALSLWLTYPTGTLAYIILTDQLSRNMHRGTDKAFASDKLALAAAKQAISRGWDLKIDPPARIFFYMPLEHAECLADQDRAVRLISSRLPEGGGMYLLHAKAHREVIRRFGRFPHRNDDLGRATQDKEKQFLDDGGYGSVVRELQSEEAA